MKIHARCPFLIDNYKSFQKSIKKPCSKTSKIIAVSSGVFMAIAAAAAHAPLLIVGITGIAVATWSFGLLSIYSVYSVAIDQKPAKKSKTLSPQTPPLKDPKEIKPLSTTKIIPQKAIRAETKVEPIPISTPKIEPSLADIDENLLQHLNLFVLIGESQEIDVCKEKLTQFLRHLSDSALISLCHNNKFLTIISSKLYASTAAEVLTPGQFKTMASHVNPFSHDMEQFKEFLKGLRSNDPKFVEKVEKLKESGNIYIEFDQFQLISSPKDRKRVKNVSDAMRAQRHQQLSPAKSPSKVAVNTPPPSPVKSPMKFQHEVRQVVAQPLIHIQPESWSWDRMKVFVKNQLSVEGSGLSFDVFEQMDDVSLGKLIHLIRVHDEELACQKFFHRHFECNSRACVKFFRQLDSDSLNAIKSDLQQGNEKLANIFFLSKYLSNADNHILLLEQVYSDLLNKRFDPQLSEETLAACKGFFNKYLSSNQDIQSIIDLRAEGNEQYVFSNVDKHGFTQRDKSLRKYLTLYSDLSCSAIEQMDKEAIQGFIAAIESQDDLQAARIFMDKFSFLSMSSPKRTRLVHTETPNDFSQDEMDKGILNYIERLCLPKSDTCSEAVAASDSADLVSFVMAVAGKNWMFEDQRVLKNYLSFEKKRAFTETNMLRRRERLVTTLRSLDDEQIKACAKEQMFWEIISDTQNGYARSAGKAFSESQLKIIFENVAMNASILVNINQFVTGFPVDELESDRAVMRGKFKVIKESIQTADVSMVPGGIDKHRDLIAAMELKAVSLKRKGIKS